MPRKPDCTRLRRACRELDVTVRIADLDDDTRIEQDHAATWVTGHTEHISFGEMYVKNRELLVDARLHVPCRYLDVKSAREKGGKPRVRCRAYGFKGELPRTTQGPPPAARASDSEFYIVHKRKRRRLRLPPKQAPRRSLPVLAVDNPCVRAKCKTADNKVGAACCRDMMLDILLPKSAKQKETLLRTRKSPYLCKFKRDDKRSVEVEIISACGYLEGDGISCMLHDRLRPNQETAKPKLCYDWPEFEEDETGHPGCVFVED